MQQAKQNPMNTPRLLSIAILAAATTFMARAAVPAAEQYLPADTLAVLAVPDCTSASTAQAQSAAGQFWADPAMKAFRDKFEAKLQKEAIDPLEKALGIKLADYKALLQGQLTLAIVRNGWQGKEDPIPTLLLVLDTKDKAEQLGKNLVEVRKKLADQSKPTRTEKIRDVEFTVLTVNLDDLNKSDAKDAPKGDDAKDKKDAPGHKVDFAFGQSGSLLIAGTGLKDIEKVLAKIGGASVPCLGDDPGYDRDHKDLFRNALGYGWIHTAPLLEILGKVVSEAAAKDQNSNPMAPKPDKILAATGLTGLRSLAFSFGVGPDGAQGALYMGVPQDKRKGLFQLIATEAKEAKPPSFVPADAVEFSRWRLDGKKIWTTIESIANEISPGMLGFFLTQMESGVKEKDPAFDFKKNFVANLGEDLISYRKAPRGKGLEVLNSAPALVLVGSPNPESLFQTVKTIAMLAPGAAGSLEFKEREFLGRKVYSIPLPSMPSADGSAKEKTLSIAAHAGYLAFSTDNGILEEFLRGSEAKIKPLAELPGLVDTAQKVGGVETGLLGYINDTENMRFTLEALKSDAGLLGKLFAATPLAGSGDNKEQALKEWVDFSLLPPFDQISKYFSWSVYAGKMTADGFSIRSLTPTPPGLKK